VLVILLYLNQSMCFTFREVPYIVGLTKNTQNQWTLLDEEIMFLSWVMRDPTERVFSQRQNVP